MNKRNLEVRKGPITEVLINRPHVANCLDCATWAELLETFRCLDEDDEVRVIILRGQGEKAFAAGSDIREMATMSPHDAARFDEVCHRAHVAVLSTGKPVIAAINGVALGGGCTLAAACDFRIASTRARLGLPEINLGIMPGAGGLELVVRLIGVSKAKRLIYTGEIIGAEEALSIGLVDRVVPDDQLLSEVSSFASSLAEKSPFSLRMAKSAVGISAGLVRDTGFAYDTLGFAICTATEEKKQAMAEFLSKRAQSNREAR